MNITGTHYNYYLICHRKLWLFHHSIQMEHTSDLVQMGKLIHETSYPNRNTNFVEVSIGNIKIDFYDPKHNVVHEIKKTGKFEDAHEWQLKYYLHILKQHGFGEVTGILEYPAQRETHPVELTDHDIAKLNQMKIGIEKTLEHEECPDITKTKACRNCAYHDFCFVGEEYETYQP